MDYTTFFGTYTLTIIGVSLLIFVARILDVSIGTVRIIFVTKGLKIPSLILGFFEVIVWLLALGQIMQNLTNPIYYLAYAGGFAMGNFVGIYIEEKVAMGTLAVQIITIKDATKLVDHLKSEGYRVTSIDAQGGNGKAKIIFTIIKRKEYRKVVGIVNRFNPKAFYSIEEVKSVNEGAFPLNRSFTARKILNSIKFKRK